MIDGLALGALPELARRQAERLHIVALVHHPLCDEDANHNHDLALSERQALRVARRIIVTSHFTKERLRELDMLPPGAPVHVAEPGVDVAPPSEEWRPGSELRWLSVGSLTPRKAHLDGLAALGEAAARSTQPWRWTIVGTKDSDPACAARLQGAIEASGLADRISLTGEVTKEELDAHYLQSHVLLHTARYEGFGMVVTEALARGLPVIASTGGALAQTLRRHGSPSGSSDAAPLAGATYPPGDVDALTRQLSDLLRSPERWNEWRATALEARPRLSSWPDASESFSASLSR